MPRKIEVEIVGDSRSLERAFRRSEKSATRFQATVGGVGRSFKGLFAAAGVTLGAGLLVKGIEDTVTAASDLNEEVNKSRVVFHRSASVIEAWSKTTADAFAISQTEALSAASNFGLLFRTFTKNDAQTAAMSRRFVELAGDLASFFNVSTDDALEKLRAGLAGEARPLREFGVFISEAKVQAEAYRDGIAKVGSKLTEAQKIQARYNVILRESKPAQGDAARTADSFANGMRRLGALIDDLKAKIGTGLLPQFNDWVQQLDDWLADEDNQKKVINDLETAFHDLGATIKWTSDRIGELKSGFDWLDKHKGPSGLDVFHAVDPRRPFRAAGEAIFGRAAFGHPDVSKVPAEWFYRFNPTLPHGPRRFRFAPGSQGWPGDPNMIPGPTTTTTPPRGGITAGQRNQWFDARIGRQLDRVQDLALRAQLARLKVIAAEVKARLAGTKDATRRLTLEDKLLEIYRQQKDVQSQITDQIQQANQALKDRAEAIKSAVLDRLDRKRQDTENKRALRDANETLRIAKQLGFARGIRVARERRQDVLFDIARARLERAPASLTRGGVFSLGNVITVNIHGITDPDKVAKAVVAAIKRNQKHTSTQTRGAHAGGR